MKIYLSGSFCSRGSSFYWSSSLFVNLVNLLVFSLGSFGFSGSSFRHPFDDLRVWFNNGAFDLELSDYSRLSFALSNSLFTFLQLFDACDSVKSVFTVVEVDSISSESVLGDSVDRQLLLFTTSGCRFGLSVLAGNLHGFFLPNFLAS